MNGGIEGGMEGGKERGREGGRERGMEGERERGREGEREGEKEGEGVGREGSGGRLRQTIERWGIACQGWRMLHVYTFVPHLNGNNVRGKESDYSPDYKKLFTSV